MALSQNELARRGVDGIEFRAEPLRAAWTFSNLTSADAHLLNVRFTCSVRVADNAADRRMCAEILLGKESSLTRQRIVEHFSDSLLKALSTIATECKADEVIRIEADHPWIARLRQAAQPIAFASGLEFLAPFELDLQSPTLREDALRKTATERQSRHLESATALLRQFQAMRDAAPNESVGRLLKQLGPIDQGQVLQSLLMTAAGEGKLSRLWAVAGPHLVEIDPRTVPPRMKFVGVPGELGPLRSVQTDVIDQRKVLLLGAQRGVLELASDNPSDGRIHACPDVESQLGFNRVIVTDQHIWATHAEIGIVHWPIDDPSSPAVYREEAARNLVALDTSRVAYSVREKLVIRDAEAHRVVPLPSNSPIVSLLAVSPATLASMHEDGTIVLIDPRTETVIDIRHRPSSISAAAMLPWMGEAHLLLATQQGPIDCIGLDDPLVTQYLSPYRGLKIVSATHDLVAAVSPDRQRVIIWHTWDGQRPVGEIHITGQARHRVADVRFEEPFRGSIK